MKHVRKDSRGSKHRTGGQALPLARAATSAEDERYQGCVVVACVLYAILNTEKNKLISSFAPLFFYLIVVMLPFPAAALFFYCLLVVNDATEGKYPRHSRLN